MIIFKDKIHKHDLYNTLLTLSRNKFFYDKIKLSDNFETRIYLMFMHFSIMMIIFKKKSKKFNQNSYDSLFNNIENNLRELGFGDVTVNKKMKELNKILYDILLKIEDANSNTFKISKKFVGKYFNTLKDQKNTIYKEFETYFTGFYNYCFELPLNNMIRNAIKFN